MKPAPNFTLPDQDNTSHSLADYRGRWVVLYFYPKDDTPGCTVEACRFRDGFSAFAKRGVQVLGVSKDSIASHKKFADKFQLNFPLLSDETAETIKAYGAWTERGFMGRPGILRKTYLINPEGQIVKEYLKVKPELHADEILRDLDSYTS
ncbi:MAG: thioredoxin-dependent thiol peroxidase [Patescibacteria group bacterium]|nr:thioredoxin-dependent thiol peroxidase [Patescibacteria group bacterium]